MNEKDSARSRTLRRLRDEAVADLTALELVPPTALMWSGAAVAYAFLMSGMLGYGLYQSWFVEALLAPFAILAFAYGGLAKIAHARYERNRIREAILNNEVVVPEPRSQLGKLLPQELSEGRTILGSLAVLVLGYNVGAMVAIRSIPVIQPLGNPAVLAGLYAIPALAVCAAAFEFISEWRKPSISREEAEGAWERQQRQRAINWGAADGQSKGEPRVGQPSGEGAPEIGPNATGQSKVDSDAADGSTSV